MKVCIIGDGLVSLTLASVLIQKNLSVDILFNSKIKKYSTTRALSISKSNIDYFNKEIINIKKILWGIKNIKVFTENLSNKEILNFTNNNKQIFSIVKNHKLYEILIKNIKKSKNAKLKKNIEPKNIIKEKYNLIINCDPNHKITKFFLNGSFEKNYNSYAYTTIIKHKKISSNNTAFQNFTKNGPIAFLPLSNTETSVVYSLRTNNDKNIINIKNLIKEFNPKYSITKINDCFRFKLKSSIPRKYYKDNILAFGDLLHKIHPLAGQGFNMSIRDIKLLSKLIDERINAGLDLDVSLCHDFQKNIQDKNYIFSSGIDWIYELFNFESKMNTRLISRTINYIGKRKFINSFFKKFADVGIKI
jgi:2-octaprenyl-6-methoxyphenol hydroxylase